MTRLAFILLIVAMSVTSASAATTQVSFSAATATGRPITLTAELSRPAGAGPFPAVVLMHGCSGPRPWGRMWSERLVRWGYVVLRPDSFGRRAIRNCAGGNATIDVRATDARRARAYLEALRFVDRRRIAVMGMGHGATAALIAVGGASRSPRQEFGAAIALYPRCYQARERVLVAPTLVLIGDEDHLSPAASCTDLGTRGGAYHALDVVVYPGATHAFDWRGLDVLYFGQRIRFDPRASADAVIRVRAFLRFHLRQGR